MKIFKRKTWVIVFSIAILLFSVTTLAQSEFNVQLSPNKIFVNDEEKVFEAPIVSIGDKTYVPLREFSEKLGMFVEWDSEEKSIQINGNSASNDGNIISIFVYPPWVSSKFAYQIDFTTYGQIATSIGSIKGEFVNDTKVFIPKVTRYTDLADVDREKLSNLISKLSDTEKTGGVGYDGWGITVFYQGKFYEYSYINKDIFEYYAENGPGRLEEIWTVSNPMAETIVNLQEFSPIKVYPFSFSGFSPDDIDNFVEQLICECTFPSKPWVAEELAKVGGCNHVIPENN